LFRFFDASDGCLQVNGQDIRDVWQASLRAAIGIVPHDTVLFNDTIYYTWPISGRGASRADIEQAARLAHIHDFIRALPRGHDTVVGGRDLKLSGAKRSASPSPG